MKTKILTLALLAGIAFALPASPGTGESWQFIAKAAAQQYPSAARQKCLADAQKACWAQMQAQTGCGNGTPYDCGPTDRRQANQCVANARCPP